MSYELLIRANELLDSLTGKEDIDTIINTLNEVLKISDRALDAVILLSRIEPKLYKKEKMLKDAIIKEYAYLKHDGAFPLNDDLYARQFLRALYELAEVYKTFGKYVLVKEVYEKMNELKNNVYHIHNELYALDAYFNNGLNKEYEVDKIDRLLIDLIYYFEHSEYELALSLKEELLRELPNLVYYFAGDEKVIDDKCQKLLTKYAFYINRITSVISFLKDGINYD